MALQFQGGDMVLVLRDEEYRLKPDLQWQFGGMEDRSFSQRGLGSTAFALEYLDGIPEIDIGRVLSAFVTVKSIWPSVLLHNGLALFFIAVSVDELAQA